MKQRFIRGGILLGVFVVALIFFSIVTNRGNDDATAAITGATLPTIHFTCEDYQIDTLVGYVDDMEIPTMRDTILPVLSDGKITVYVDTYGTQVDELSYEVLSLDGETSLLSEVGSLTKYEKNTYTGTLETADAFAGLEPESQLVLKITLAIDSQKANYYTRIEIPNTAGLKACLDFAQNVHEQALGIVDGTTLGSMLETTGDAPGGFEMVTIHSTYDQITWSGLEPDIVGDVQVDVTESNSVYSSIVMKYRVTCNDEVTSRETYEVREFFRIRGNSGKLYLLNYERTMDHVLDTSKKILDEKGIRLGVVGADTSYLTNEDGTLVSFVVNRELYAYNQEEDALSKIFSFEDRENQDSRSYYDQNNIHLQNVEKDGSTIFTVSGYMNRGSHEGQVGVAVYYYDSQRNCTEEKVFIPTRQSYAFSRENLSKFIYFNSQNDQLYLMSGGSLYQIKIDGKKIKKSDGEELVSGLKEGQYTSSEDGRMIACEKDGVITVRNLEEDKTYTVEADSGEQVIPLGFVRGDFVCGYRKASDEGTLISGEKVTPLYKVEITDGKKSLKTYQVDNLYIQNVDVTEDMITLHRLAREGDNYSVVADDYIKNNEETDESNIIMETFSTELMGTETRLLFADGIEDTNPKILEPKFVVNESKSTLTMESERREGMYYVFGYGRLEGGYDTAGQAIVQADLLSGVVTDDKQQIIWERGNRDLVYNIDAIGAFTNGEGMTSKDSCLNQLKSITGKTDENLLNLTGCITEQTLYLVNHNKPIVVMADENNAVLIVGYADGTVTFIDPNSGSVGSASYTDMDAMAAGSGGTMISIN